MARLLEASCGALNDVLGSIHGGMGGNKSLGTVLGNVLGSKAGDILGGLLGGRRNRPPHTGLCSLQTAVLSRIDEVTASPERAANERADFRDSLEYRRHALFADSGEEWRDALVRLIRDAELRRGLVEESKKLIEQFYRIVRSAKPLAHAMVLAKNGAPERRGIEPGRDGWVIDVSDDADLRHLLRHLTQIPPTGHRSRGSPKRAALKRRWTNL